MKKREPLFTDEHFSEVIKYFARKINETIKDLSEHPEEYKNISFVYYCFYADNRDLMAAKYSAGYPVEDLKYHVEELINWFIKNKEHPDNSGVFFDALDFYVDYLQLYALGVIFSIEKEVLQKLLTLIGHDGEDALLDKLALSVFPDRKQGTKLQHPKAYQSLYDAINSPKEEQPRLMQKFLKGWYKSMRKCGWHDVHLSVGKDGFPGYWCWEAAMVTVMYGIDDSTYRDMPFYPKDMVDYAKQQNP